MLKQLLLPLICSDMSRQIMRLPKAPVRSGVAKRIGFFSSGGFGFIAMALAVSGRLAFALPISGTVVVQPVLVNPTGGAVADSSVQDALYTNAIYSQIGINFTFNKPLTITQDSPTAATPGTWTPVEILNNLNAGFDLNSQTLAAYKAANGGAAPPANVFPLYYLTSISGANGVAYPQSLVGAGKTPASTAIPNSPRNDSVAHELGHMLLNPWRWRNGQNAEPQGFHSNNKNDLMGSGALPRNAPTSLKPSAPKNSTPAPIGNLDTIGIDSAGQPTFGYINDNNAGGLAAYNQPIHPQYVMPEINAMYGASDAGGTPTNSLVTKVKTVSITMTVGNTSVSSAAWGSTQILQATDASGPITAPLVVNETARVQSLATPAVRGVEQFVFEYRDPTGYPGGGGKLNLTESGLKNLDTTMPYSGFVPNSLQLWEGSYTIGNGPAGTPPHVNPPDTNTVLNQLPAAAFSPTLTLGTGGQLNWAASVNFSALAGNTDLFVEFSAYVPEPSSLALLAVAAAALLRPVRRSVGACTS